MTHRYARPNVPCLLLALIVTCALAAPTAVLAQENGFNAVYSRDGIDVWAVGQAGFCYRSLDGGVSWTSTTVGTKTLRGAAARGFTVHLVGDDGIIQRSTNSGGTFLPDTLPGAPDLLAVHFADDLKGWICGEGGAIFVTTDGGVSWSTQTSGVVFSLTAIDFLDPDTGWIVGHKGTVLATVDGGDTWTLQTPPATEDFFAVDATLVGASEPVVWAVGRRSTAVKSLDGGVSWDDVPLKIDSKVDVTGVRLLSSTSLVLTGGGGFLRASINGGASWIYRQHLLQGDATALFFHTDAQTGWMCNRSNRMVLRTSNSGVTWALPGGATVNRSFAIKRTVESGTVRGSTLDQHPTNLRTFYAILGARLYKSQDRAETWSHIGTIPSASKTNSFYVSRSDTLTMVAATGTPDRIVRTVNGGTTWSTTFTSQFTEYGVPLERDPNNPERLIFGSEDGNLYESLDFGATWDTLSTPGFRSPCDIQIVPDSSDVIWVGDGVTSIGNGELFVSTDGGANFDLEYTTTGSEVPMIAASRLAPGVGWTTHWASGGVRRTTDYGASWPQVAVTSSAWGVDVAKDDPNCMAFATYSGSQFFLSFDQGTTYSAIGVGGSNYSVFLSDRNTILAEQGGGIYKLSTTYNYTPSTFQSLTVLTPNGGEVWLPGEVRNVSFASTKVALVRIEYRERPGEPWQLLTEQEGYDNSFAWTVPDDATDQAKIRVVDAWDSTPTDSSNAVFTIAAPRVELLTAGLDFGTQGIGVPELLPVTLHSTGTATLQITSVSTTLGAYVPGRTAFTIAAADSDTVGVTFTPDMAGSFPDTLVIVSNAPDSPHRIPLMGAGQAAPAVAVLDPDGGEEWAYNSVQAIEWFSAVVESVAIDWRAAPAGPWTPIVASWPAESGSYDWTIPYAPTTTARVRIRDLLGAVIDSSAADFSITAPLLAALPDTIDFGLVAAESFDCLILSIDNDGTAPLSILDLTSTNPRFAPVRTSFVIAPASSDTVTICYTPGGTGTHTGALTIASNDPFAPHEVGLKGWSLPQSSAPDGAPRPAVFTLRQNRPNPFSGRTRLEFELPEAGPVRLEVFDLEGRLVARLVNGPREAGRHEVEFGPGLTTSSGDRVGELASGIYFYRLTAGNRTRTERMLYLR